MRERQLLDPVIERIRTGRLSVDEEQALRDSHWAMGQDVRLRDDIRLRPTPWQRWTLADTFIANDLVLQQLRRSPGRPLEVEATLQPLDHLLGRRCILCPADPRIVVENDCVRLSARELSAQPLIQDTVADFERYVTHLPVHSLRAAAASEPAGQWGPRAQEEVIETFGWIQVTLSGRKLNARMFVAQVEGHSMDDGRSGLVDGGYAVFELWPSGSKQNLSVLVRGTFSDPETGGYAVKRYVADHRDEEGRHHRVALVSLHPDKQRFPDIELRPENDDDITVVAKVVQALAQQDFARSPKLPRRRGRRDISSTSGREEISEQLAEHLKSFFAGTPSRPATDRALGRPDTTAWYASLVCLDAAAGGLHIEAGPLQNLWSFVKRLTVAGREWDSTILASNIRQRAIRIPVPPASGPWGWLAPGFEDDGEIDLSSLTIPLLDTERVHVFRVDIQGIGRLQQAIGLSPGQSYRLLVPRPLLAGTPPEFESAGPGWLLGEIEVPLAPPTQLLGLIDHLGLRVTHPEPQLEWVVVPPAQWKESAGGNTYACFTGDLTPVVQLRASHVETAGDAAVFVHGPDGTVTTQVPSGNNHLMQLKGLVPGQYVLMLAHERTAVPAPKLTFEILAGLKPQSYPAGRLTAGQDALVAQPGEPITRAPQDFSSPERSGILDEIQIDAPPGWPVRVLWRELTEEPLAQLSAGEEGRIEAFTFASVLYERLTRRPLGDIIFDFAELGRIVLQHERRADPESLRARFSELIANKAPTVERLAGEFESLLPIWFEPVVAGLGFDIEPFPPESIQEAPTSDHVRPFRLLHIERHRQRIRRKVVRVLVLLGNLTPSLSTELLKWIDDICATEDVREVLLSDGLHWASHRRGSHLSFKVYNLKSLVTQGETFLSFLHEASEGI